MEDRRSARQCELDDLARPSAAARRKPVPYRDQHVAMRDRGPAGHHISLEPMTRVAGQLEHGDRAIDQRIEPSLRTVIRQAGAIGGALERQDRFEVPAKLERKLGRHLVSAIGDRRHEPQLAWPRSEAVAFLLEEVGAGAGDQFKRLSNSLTQRIDAPVLEHVSAVARDSDAEHERDERRARRTDPPGYFTELRDRIHARLNAVAKPAEGPKTDITISRGPHCR